MFKARTTLTLALSAGLALLGSAAAAWSPLQYDGVNDVSSIDSEHSVYKEIMNRLDQQSEAAGSGAAEQPSAHSAAPAADSVLLSKPAPSPGSREEGGEASRQAESAIEDDAASETAKATKPASEELVEITPKAQPKPPGKMPTEGILDPWFFYNRSQAFMQNGDYQSALNYINRALALNGSFWEAWYEKALIYQLAGCDGPAARRYLALIERRPDMLPAHIGLGMLYRKHGNNELAEGEYNEAIALNPRCFAAHYNLANLMMDEGHQDRALKEYQLCLKIKPDDAHVHNNIGVIYQHRKYFEEAQAEFTKATHLDPANNQFAANLSNLCRQIGEKPGKLPL